LLGRAAKGSPDAYQFKLANEGTRLAAKPRKRTVRRALPHPMRDRAADGLRPSSEATMILVAYRYGLRASEVCDLQWQQIELSEGPLGLHSSTA